MLQLLLLPIRMSWSTIGAFNNFSIISGVILNFAHRGVRKTNFRRKNATTVSAGASTTCRMPLSQNSLTCAIFLSTNLRISSACAVRSLQNAWIKIPWLKRSSALSTIHRICANLDKWHWIFRLGNRITTIVLSSFLWTVALWIKMDACIIKYLRVYNCRIERRK